MTANFKAETELHPRDKHDLDVKKEYGEHDNGGDHDHNTTEHPHTDRPDVSHDANDEDSPQRQLLHHREDAPEDEHVKQDAQVHDTYQHDVARSTEHEHADNEKPLAEDEDDSREPRLSNITEPPNDSNLSADRTGQELINLFVRNVAKHVTEQQLVDLFSKYGSVDSAVVVRDPHSKECRGFGFVKMLSEEDAQEAIEGLREYQFEGRRIAVEKAKRKTPHSRTPGAYMGVDRRIRDRYAGMKRSRDYNGMDRGGYAYGYGDREAPRGGAYRGRYEDEARGGYMNRGWDARQNSRMAYGGDRERNPIRRRYESEDPHQPIDPEGELRLREREPPVPRESADDVI